MGSPKIKYMGPLDFMPIKQATFKTIEGVFANLDACQEDEDFELSPEDRQALLEGLPALLVNTAAIMEMICSACEKAAGPEKGETIH